MDDETIAGIESALHSLARRLKQARLHEFVLKQAGVDIDQAGLAILYALHAEKVSLRVTDLAERLGIDAPAVTRKAQRLERLGLVSRARTPRMRGCAGCGSASRGRRRSAGSSSPAISGSRTLLADWPPEERCDFARLIGRFAGDIHRHLDELGT